MDQHTVLFLFLLIFVFVFVFVYVFVFVFVFFCIFTRRVLEEVVTGGQGETFKQEYGWINIRLPVGALLNDDDPQ